MNARHHDSALPSDVQHPDTTLVAADAKLHIQQRAQRRIRDYRLRALEAADPVAAVLGNMNADLLVSQSLAAAQIPTEFASGRPSLEEFEAFRSAMDLQIRFAKQIAQITHLTMVVGDDGADRPART